MPVVDCTTGETREHSEEELAAIAAAPGSVGQVVAERERRLSGGFDYDFGDERGTHRIGTTEQDMKGWDEVTTFAQAAMALGQSSAAIVIKTETGAAQVTAEEWLQILLAAFAFRQPLWQASFVLQAMDPIPGDFADDAHWPAAAS